MLASVNGTGFFSWILNSDITVTASLLAVLGAVVEGAVCASAGSAKKAESQSKDVLQGVFMGRGNCDFGWVGRSGKCRSGWK